jgi:hypothetical protein
MRRSLFLAAAASTILLSRSIAIAQEVPSPTEYFQADQTISCAGPQGFCTLHFPATKSLTLITRAACLVITSGTIRTIVVGYTSTAGGFTFTRSEFLPINASPVVYNGSNWHSMSWTTDFLVGTGRFPAVSVDAFPDGSYTVNCRLTGRKVATP